jgi:preprotein translocase subunit YajC
MMLKFISADGFFSDPSMIMLIVLLGLFVVAMFVMPLFTKRKKNQVNDLYANLAVGDKIMTIGGIIGTVIEIKERSPNDKDLLIETGSEGSKTTIWLDLKGLYQNLSKPPVPTNFFGKPKNVPAKTEAADEVSEAAPAETQEPEEEAEPFDAPAAAEEKETAAEAETVEAVAAVADDSEPAADAGSVEKKAKVKSKK